MPVAIIGAGLAAAGAVGGAVIGANASNRAADVAAANATAHNHLAQAQFDSTKALVQPYVDRGGAAADALQGFLGLGGDPAKAHAAFDNYLGSTGYQFARDQGVDAAEQSASARGLLNSGAALKALQDRGTGLAQQYGQAYVDNLNSVANRGTSAINALTGAGGLNAASQTANNTAAASARGSALVNAGNLYAGVINGLGASAGKVLGASSFGGGSSSSAYAALFNQDGYAPFRAG
jgi:hypothetical protein